MSNDGEFLLHMLLTWSCYWPSVCKSIAAALCLAENVEDYRYRREVKKNVTYMRLLGGILRPSLNQVTWGWGKLRMRGAGITAPSPWETDWVRSPSSKLPITRQKANKKYNKTGKQNKRINHTYKSRAQISLWLSLTFGDHRAAVIPFVFGNVPLSRVDEQSSVITVHQQRLKGLTKGHCGDAKLTQIHYSYIPVQMHPGQSILITI